jgi:TetR/AcrR family transcriptional regulator
MSPPRRRAADDSSSRKALLDAAEAIMIEEGYAAVSSRRLATKAGVNSALVYYYFDTMDGLFIELFRRGSERSIERFALALLSPQPLWAFWEITHDQGNNARTMEFIALANHRKTLRAEIARYAERFRIEQIRTLTAAMERYDVPFEEFSPTVLMVLMTGATQVLVQEQLLDMTAGHEETLTFAEKWLTFLEGPLRLDVDWRHPSGG